MKRLLVAFLAASFLLAGCREAEPCLPSNPGRDRVLVLGDPVSYHLTAYDTGGHAMKDAPTSAGATRTTG